MSYQGWENYETWCVNLWLSNEEPSYRYWRERAQEVWAEAKPDAPLTRSEVARRVLGDELKESHENGVEELPIAGTVWSDLLGAALSDVNWGEVAQAWLEECDGYEWHEFPWKEAAA